MVAADCTSVACPAFHRDLLRGRVVMMGCPKFDDTGLYAQRFAEIFAANDIKSVTVAIMEVPCCQGMLAIVGNAIHRSGKSIPVEQVTVSLRGEILERGPVANGPNGKPCTGA